LVCSIPLDLKILVVFQRKTQLRGRFWGAMADFMKAAFSGATGKGLHENLDKEMQMKLLLKRKVSHEQRTADTVIGVMAA
jgi:hypothetical protein